MLPYAADYTIKRTVPEFPGNEQIQMPRWIAALGPKRIMIGLPQDINTTKR